MLYAFLPIAWVTLLAGKLMCWLFAAGMISYCVQATFFILFTSGCCCFQPIFFFSFIRMDLMKS